MAHKALKAHTSPRRNLRKRALSSLSSLSSHIFCVKNRPMLPPTATSRPGFPGPHLAINLVNRLKRAEFYKLLSTPSNKRLNSRRNIDNPAHKQRDFYRFFALFAHF
ncbi:MAG: hypothetical protein QOE55_1166 [Acidobacteriaceae bacterium]|jgi:hypothetical protein|nr:hypothetical protein [Acidobacteriaceae bacterium]